MTETNAISAGDELWSPAMLQQRMLRLRQVLIEALDIEKMKAVCHSLIQQAVEGSFAATKLLLGYSLGRPERIQPPPSCEARVLDAPAPPAAVPRTTPAPTTSTVDMALFTPGEFQDLLRQTPPRGKASVNKR